MERTIITTVGTSLITNFFETLKEKKEEDKNANDYNEKLKKFCYYHTDSEKTIIEKNKPKLFEKIKSCINCAEISSLETIKQELQKEDANIQIKVYLICTDTVLSPLCACIVECYLKKKGFDVKFEGKEEYIIKGLRVDDKNVFEDIGFEGLMNCIDTIATKPKNCILNISGGYKALIPPLTLYGQLKNIPLNYKYEDSPAIIEIGNLPIGIDWSFVEALKPFLKSSHKLWSDANIEYAKAYFKKEKELPTISNRNHKNLIEAIFDLKLVKFIEDDNIIKLKPTVLGLVMQSNSTLSGYQGYIMEYILFHYFSKTNRDSKVYKYKSTIPYECGGYFKVNSNNGIDISESEQKGFRKIGDIDLPLICDEIYVLGECKALSAFESIQKEKEHYYSQLKARILRFSQKYPDKIIETNPSVEILIVLFDFQFKGFESNPLNRPTVIDIISHFKNLEKESNIKFSRQGKEITIKPIFNIVGLKCLIELDTKKIFANYTSFYDKPNFSWEILNQNNNV